MPTDRRYKSSIPADAKPRIVERYDDGRKRCVQYFVNRKLVGERTYDEEGYLYLERPYKDGMIHGVEYWWYFDGVLTSAAPYKDGKPHGVAKQWSQSGKLIGTYKMVHGTGIDLWWTSLNFDDEPPFLLSEVHYVRDGRPHGYTWFLEHDQKSVFVEYHFSEGVEHGIQREWNAHGRLCRGYPQYFVAGKKVDKRRYIRAAAKDKSLPEFRLKDNDAHRVFPKEIRKHLLKRK